MGNRLLRRAAIFLIVTVTGCHSHNLPVEVDRHVLIFNEDGRACDSHRNFRQMPEATYVNQMDSVLAEMDRYHAAHPAVTDHKSIRRILIFIHGGLTEQDSALERDALQYKYIQQAGYYPIFINWDSDLFSAYGEHLLWIRQGRKETDPVRRFGQILTSPLYLLADVGRAVTRAPSVWVHLGADDADAAGNRWVSVHQGQPHWLENDQSLYAAKYYSVLHARYASTQPNTSTDRGQIRLSMGAEESTANFWRWDSLKYIVTMPAKLMTTPIIDSLGKSAWEVLCRRTVNLFEDPLDTRALGASEKQMAQLLDYGPPGDLQWFLHKLQDHIDADPDGDNYEITLIGHSMGSMVINELLRHNPNLEIKNIVYMAAACSIHDFRRDAIPYMQAHPQTQVYNLCLHPTAEVTEAEVHDLPPRGSLLVWIDEFLGEPRTPLDRTLGRWDNILPATYIIPPELRDRINIKAFAMTANGNRSDPLTNQPAPQVHGDFTWTAYWDPKFWRPASPGDPQLLKLIDQLNTRLAEVEKDLPKDWKFKEETTRDQFRTHKPASQKAAAMPAKYARRKQARLKQYGMTMQDPWFKLRDQTTVRIALGRAGGSLPTAAVLAFAADHAAARDAVYSQLDVGTLQQAMASLELPIVVLRTQAVDRQTYLHRPDLGRRLDAASIAAVQSVAAGDLDVALIVGDGLSALAAQSHAADLLGHLIPKLRERGFTVAPLSIVTQARVAVEDEIGSLLRARLAVILIGERPGLGAADSLGAYLIHNPSIGRTDADRNCVSNIRPQQLHPAIAANTLAWLIEQSIRRRLSGVQLKDERDPTLLS